MSSDGTPTVPYGTGGKLLRAVPSTISPLYDLLAQNAFEFKHWEDNFEGDQLKAEYPAAKTNGASAAVTFTEHNAQGFLDLVTGTANDGYAGQGVGLQWTGDRGMLAEFLFTTPASLADFKLEVGVSDADDDAGAVATKSATPPTATATDFAVLCYDVDDDSLLTLIHAKTGTVAAVETGFTLQVSTVYYVAIRVTGDNVQATIRGLSGTPGAEVTVANATAAAGIEGGSALTPWFFAQARAGSASKTVPLHKWAVTWPAW